MRHHIGYGVLAMVLIGCSDSTAPRANQYQPPPVEYNVNGVVIGDSVVLAGVSVTITNTSGSSKTTATDSQGTFSFTGISGTWFLTVSRDGFFPQYRTLVVAGDQTVVIFLARSAQAFELGKLLTFAIRAGDSPCDPVHWDARAPCARLRFMAPRSGVLSVQVDWGGPGDMDFTIMSGDGQRYLAYSGSGHTLTSEAAVAAGQYYEIWVHSYYGAATFTVAADVR